MKRLFTLCVFFLLILLSACVPTVNTSSGEEAEAEAKMQALTDSLSATIAAQQALAETQNTADTSQKIAAKDEHIFLSYAFLSSHPEAPTAHMKIANIYNQDIISISFILATSKNRQDHITDRNTIISYTKYDVQIKSGDTLDTQIKFVAPKGWSKENYSKIFVYRVTTTSGYNFKPELKLD